MHSKVDTKATVARAGDQWVILFADDSTVLYCKDPDDIGTAIVSHFAERRLKAKPFVESETDFHAPQQLEIDFHTPKTWSTK